MVYKEISDNPILVNLLVNGSYKALALNSKDK
jgi:hypothetical protein